jgi:excisionase family DNA binding protein
MSDSPTIAVPAPLFERMVSVLERLDAQLKGAVKATDSAAAALLTLREVAERLQKSERDVQRLVKAGKLKRVADLGKRTTRFRPADVDRFLADKETQPGRRRL